MRDVAARAGVSIKTVSRVVNGERYVVEDVRARVAAAVNALGYSPNVAARALAGRNSYLIGLFFDDPGSGYAADVHIGALTRCRERGYHLVVERVDLDSPRLMSDLRESVGALRLDGAILTPPICDHPGVLAAFEGLDVQIVRIAPDMDPERSAYVGMDDRAAAFEMTSHLAELGHVRIGFVLGPASHGASRRRLQGHREALAARGLHAAPALEAPGDFSFRSGVEAGARLLALPDPPTAVFASNDDMALGVLSVAARLGVQTPAQLSVAGFDDTPSARVVWPQLTTIRQPKGEMAAAAVDLAIGRPASGDGADRTLGFTLMRRESTGPAPK